MKTAEVCSWEAPPHLSWDHESVGGGADLGQPGWRGDEWRGVGPGWGWTPTRPRCGGRCRGEGRPRGPPRHPTQKNPWGRDRGRGEGLLSTTTPRAVPEPAPQGGRRVTGGDATSHVEGAVWRLWFPARPGGDPSVVGGPPRQAPPEIYSPGPSVGHTADPLWPREIGSQMGLAFSQMIFLAPLHRLYFF